MYPWMMQCSISFNWVGVLDVVKLDLKNAYRMVLVDPQDQHLREGMTYVDCAIPFGLRSAPKKVLAVADAIALALHLQRWRKQKLIGWAKRQVIK